MAGSQFCPRCVAALEAIVSVDVEQRSHERALMAS
jgi:hypothetical protein